MREPKDHFQTTALTEHAEEAPSEASEFQETELGSLPAHWKVVRLGGVVEGMRMGRTPPRAEPHHWQNGTVPWVAIADLNNGTVTRTKEAITQEALDRFFGGKLLPEGTLLLSFKLTVGKVGILGVPAVHNEAIVSLFPRPVIDRDFLFFLMLGYDFDDYLDTYVKGKTLNRDKLESIPIPLPPLEEQRAIARVLRAVQQARDATQQVIDAAQQLKKSLMQRLFTHGVNTPAFTEGIEQNPSDRGEFQETELGPLPAHWKVVRLGEVFEIVQGKSLSAKRNLGVRPRYFLRTSNVYWGSVNLAKIDQMDFTEEEETKYKLMYGDLLVCEGGEVGRTAMWEGQLENVYFQNHIYRLRAICEEVHPQFVMYWMEYAFRIAKAYEGTSNKTTIPNLSRGRLANFHIPLPPLEEQRAIASVLKAVDAKIAAERARRDALNDLLQTLLRDLMSGRRRVCPHAYETGADSEKEYATALDGSQSD